MDVKPLLGLNAEPVFGVGGPNAWKTHEFRSLNVSLEWAKSGRRYLRVLCIWPQARLVHAQAAGAGVWAIAHTAMVEFLHFDTAGKATGKPSDELFREAREALPMLGKDRNDRAGLFELIDCVLTHGPELARMPVAPRAVRRRLADEAMWEIEAKNKATGKTISEAAV